jgi:AcrR family transcriptional regulator
VPAPRPRSRRHAPPEVRRAQILGAALACFGDKGYHAATMDDLARAAGLSKGSLYWHFRSKEAVFMAVFDAFEEELLAEWERRLATGRGALEAAGGMMGHAFAALGEGGRLARAWAEFLSHPQGRERLAAAYRRIRAQLVATLEGDVARGAVRDLPLESVAAALTAAGEGLMLQAMVDESFDPRAHWPTTFEMIRRGLEP